MKNKFYFFNKFFFAFFSKILLLVLLFFVCFSSMGQTLRTRNNANPWSFINSWTTGVCDTGTPHTATPGVSNDVIICNGRIMTANVIGAECRNLTVQAGAVLNVDDLTVNGDMIINGIVLIDISGNLTVTGDIIVNPTGTIEMDTSFPSTIRVDGNMNLGGTVETAGSLGNISVGGNMNIQSGGLLDVTTDRSISVEGNWSNLGTFNAGTGIVQFDGATTQAISGNATTFNNIDVLNSGTIINTSVPVFVGGTINVNNGTTVNLSNVFTVGSPGVMNINNGGTVRLLSANTTINTLNILGGTFSHESSTSTAVFNGNITNNGTFTTAAAAATYRFTFRGNITNNVGAVFNLRFSSQTVFDGATTITNNSSNNMRFAAVNSGTMNLNIGRSVTIAAGSGDVFMNITSASGGVVIDGTFTNNSDYLFVSRLTGTGTFNNTGEVTSTSASLSDVTNLTCSPASIFNYNYGVNGFIRGTGAIYGTLNITGAGTKTLGGANTSIAGNLTVSGGAILNTTTDLSTIIFNGAIGDQTITGATDFYNLTINKAGGDLELAIGANTVAQRLTLTDGNLILNGNLNLTNANHTLQLSGGSIGSHIVTGAFTFIREGVNATTNVFFPIGRTSTTYNPLTIVNTGNFGDVSVNVENLDPAVGRPRVARVWNIQNVGTPEIRFDWSSGGATVGTMTSPTVYQYVAPSWNNANPLIPTTVGTQTATATLPIGGTRQFAIFDPPSVDYYAVVNNGNWNNAATWSIDCISTGGAGVPTANDNVFICNGITVNLNVNAQCKDLAIQGGILQLDANDLLVGGDLTIDGAGILDDNTAGGTLTLQGDFTNNGNFTASGGTSTFNFNGDNTYSNLGTINLGDNIITLNAPTNSTFTNLGLINVANIVGTLGGGTENLISQSNLTVIGTGQMLPNLTLDFDNGGEVFYSNSGGSQILANTSYNNITLQGNNGTKNTTGTINVNRNWSEFITGTDTRSMLGTINFIGGTNTYIVTNGLGNLGNVVINKDPTFEVNLIGNISGTSLEFTQGKLITAGNTTTFDTYSGGNLNSYIQLPINGSVPVIHTNFPANTPVTFPIGTTNSYNPITFETPNMLAPTISVGLNLITPALPTNTGNLNIQWEVQSSLANTDLETGLTFDWNAVANGNVTGEVAFFDGVWSSLGSATGTSATTTSTATLANPATTYSFTAYVPALTFYSRQTGNWSDNTTTWAISSGGPDCGCSPTGVAGATVIIENGHEITVLNATDIAANNSIELQGTSTLTLNNGNTNSIDLLTNIATSTINLGGGNLNLTPTNTDINGTLRNTGGTLPNFTLTFTNGSTYEHARNGAVIPTANWGATSNCLVTGITTTPFVCCSPNGLGQMFGNFTWDCAGQTSNQAVNQNIIVQGTTSILNTNTANITLASNNDYVWTTSDFIINPTAGNTAIFLLANGGSRQGTLRILGDFNDGLTPTGNAIWGNSLIAIATYTDKIEFAGTANQNINLPNFVGGGTPDIIFEVNKSLGTVNFTRTDFISSINPILNINSGTFALNETNAQTLTIENIIGTGTLSMQNDTHLLNIEGTGNTFNGTLDVSPITTINYNGIIPQGIFVPTTGSYGNLSFEGDGFKTPLGNISISGNLTKNSGTATFNAISPTVLTFNGTTPQTITVDGGIVFYNLVINNGAANVSLGLNTGISISNSLTLTAGRLVLNDNDLFYNGTGAITASTGSWVETNNAGSFVLITPQNPFTFPVGDDTNYYPIEIATTIANSSVRFGIPFSSITGAGSWFVNNGSQASIITLISPIGVATDAEIHRKNGVNWENLTTTYPTGNFATNYNFGVNTEEFALFSAPFTTTWTTTNPSEIITIPVDAAMYNYTIYWEEVGNPSNNSGGVITSTDASPNNIITLGTATGDYKVEITGDFPRINFGSSTPTNAEKITSIDKWGSIQWQSMQSAFDGCTNLTYTATDNPILTNVSDMSRMFADCSSLVGTTDIQNWNVSGTLDFSEMFDGAELFNSPLNNWIVTNATSFAGMFDGTTNFDQDLNNWTFTAAAPTDFSSMFEDAISFNRDISTWNTFYVTDMSDMFNGASSFDQNLASWDLSSVTNMSGMLDDCGMLEATYDATLIGWRDDNFGMETIPLNITLGANGLTYCNSIVERGELISIYGWNIIGDQNCIEINVRSNGNDIVDGDMTPDINDNTDFGSAIDCGVGIVTKIFNIQNTGGSPLLISNITITGANAADFNLGVIPNIVPPADNRFFRITFNPSGLGLRTATVTIDNNDPDENPYDFAIQGTGDVDNQPPILVTHDNYTRNTDETNCFYTNRFSRAAPRIPEGRAFDNCGIDFYRYVLTGATSGVLSSLVAAQFNTGITTITWRATDNNGNVSAPNQFTVTVLDTQNPSIEAPLDIEIFTDLYACDAVSINVDLGNPVASDNCSFDISNNAPTRFPVGQTIVTWTAIDSSGNVSTDEQIIRVRESLFVLPSDSLILVDIYNQTGGQNWNTSWNLNAPASTWAGVGIRCGKVITLNLSNNNLTGILPISVLGLSSINDPAFSLNIGSNRLVFDSTEDFVRQINNFRYSPQAEIYSARTEIIEQSENIIFTSQTAGNFNRYQWYKDQTVLNGANLPTLAIQNAQIADAGVYVCEVTNTRATQLTLERRPITLIVEGFVNPTDSLALVQIFEETDGDNWIDSWNLFDPVATWEGITLNGSKIRELDLSSQNLSGVLPNVFDADFFSELRYLSFFDNKLEGQIPASLGAITTLTYLDLDKNNFEGTVPASLGNLTNLQALWLSRNNLTSLPTEIGNLSSLKTLYLNDNQFTSLPESIGNLTELLVLNVSDNELIGLPNSITNLIKLIEFYANRNYITTIPIGVENFENLTTFEINANQLSVLSTRFLQLNNLSKFGVSENNLEFDDLLPFSNQNYLAFTYSPQAPINEEQDIVVSLNTSVSFAIQTQGNGNVYQWFKDGIPVSSLQNFNINRVRNADTGLYTAQITNANLPELILQRRSILLNIECQEAINFQINQPSQTIFCNEQPFALKLEINPAFTFNQQIRWKKDEIILAFATDRSYTVTQAGVYKAEVITANGCTAISNNIEIKVLPQPQISIELVNQTTFTSTLNSQEPVTYQWLKDGIPIEKGLESTYTPIETGEYSLLVLTTSGCNSISESIIFTQDITALEEPKELRNLAIYPNPNKGIFFIDFGTNAPNGEPIFSVIDAIGRQLNLKTERISSSRYKTEISNLTGGMYYIQIQTKDGIAFRKFVIEE